MKNILLSLAAGCASFVLSSEVRAAEIPFSLEANSSIEVVTQKLSQREGFKLKSKGSDENLVSFDLKNFDLDGVEFNGCVIQFYQGRLMNIALTGGIVKLEKTDEQVANLQRLKNFYLQQGEKLIIDELSEAKTFKDVLQDRFLLVFETGPCMVRIKAQKFEFQGVWSAPIVEYSVKEVFEKYQEQKAHHDQERKEKSKSLLK
jgi:hypothetical protein